MVVLEWDCGMMTRVSQLMLNAVRLQYGMKLVWSYSWEVLLMNPEQFLSVVILHVKCFPFRISAHWHRARPLEVTLLIKCLNKLPPFSMQVEVKGMQIVNRNYLKDWIFSFTTQILPETSTIKSWPNWLKYWTEILKTWLPKVAVLRGVLLMCCWHISEGEDGLRRGQWLLVMSSQSSRWREILTGETWAQDSAGASPSPTQTDTASAPGHSQGIHWPCELGNGFGSPFEPGRAVWLGWPVPAAEPAGVLCSRSTSWRAGIYSCGSVRAAEDESGFPAASVSDAGPALVLLTPSPSQPFSQCRAEIPLWGENPLEFQMSCS